MRSDFILLLGYGMQGKAALFDLCNSGRTEEIIVVDCNPNIDQEIRLLGFSNAKGINIDASNKEKIKGLIQKASLVVELLPASMALEIAQIAIEVGTNLVRSGYLGNPGETNPSKIMEQEKRLIHLNNQAQEKGVTVLREFGMDPGIDLVLGNKALSELDDVKVFHSYGAGFPSLSSDKNPLRYKFSWSPIGVMKSYFRPAKIIRDGKFIEIPAIEQFSSQNMHLLRIDELEEDLECYPNGDSVRFAQEFGLLNQVESMGRYICRWPGHGFFWERMAKCGFLSEDPIRCGEIDLVPVEFCASLLNSQKQFFYGDDESDVALIRIDVRGFRSGVPVRVIYQMIDKRDFNTGFTAMQRTVGFPVSIGAQMILDGEISKKGIVGPKEVPFDYFMIELKKRGLEFKRLESVWDGSLDP